jgi:hypothetical protein
MPSTRKIVQQAREAVAKLPPPVRRRPQKKVVEPAVEPVEPPAVEPVEALAVEAPTQEEQVKSRGRPRKPAEPVEVEVVEQPRGKGRPRIHKKTNRKPNNSMKLWNEAMKDLQLLNQGNFKQIPKKGTDEYVKLKELYERKKASLTSDAASS